LGVALQAYSYYGYAQMAVGAIRAIEGGGTAMANFAGGMAKGYAKSMLFNGAIKGLSHLQNKASANGPDAAKAVDNTQGSDSADGHVEPTGKKNGTYLDTADREALDASIKSVNEKISKLGYFSSREDAAAWLHDNAFSITETHGAEIYARIFTHAEGVSIGNITTSYHTGYVGPADQALSKSFKPSWEIAADWHTHPAIGAANFSQADYQVMRQRYVSFKDSRKESPGLRRYDGIAAWRALNRTPTPAMPDMTLAHGDKYSTCIRGGC
jgi:hypothetical protein